MLSKSLDVVDSEEWTAELGEAFGQQIPLYSAYVEERVSYVCWNYHLLQWILKCATLDAGVAGGFQDNVGFRE